MAYLVNLQGVQITFDCLGIVTISTVCEAIDMPANVALDVVAQTSADEL